MRSCGFVIEVICECKVLYVAGLIFNFLVPFLFLLPSPSRCFHRGVLRHTDSVSTPTRQLPERAFPASRIGQAWFTTTTSPTLTVPCLNRSAPKTHIFHQIETTDLTSPRTAVSEVPRTLTDYQYSNEASDDNAHSSDQDVYFLGGSVSPLNISSIVFDFCSKVFLGSRIKPFRAASHDLSSSQTPHRHDLADWL